MKIAKLLFLLSMSFAGLAVWQSVYPGASDEESTPDRSFAYTVRELADSFGVNIDSWIDVPEDSANATANQVSLRNRTVKNDYLVEARRQMERFEPFPFDFDLMTIEGRPLCKDEFRGRVLIVDIWATWCPPCRAEVPSFVTLHEQYSEAGLSIVGLNYERADEAKDAILAINEFRQLQPVSYPLAIGNPSVTTQVPSFSGFPTTLFIDHTGTVRMMVTGGESASVLESYALLLMSEVEDPASPPLGTQPKLSPQILTVPIQVDDAGPQSNPYANKQLI